MENTNKIGSINIQNNALGYAIIDKEFTGINTSELKRLVAQSAYVKSYLDTPIHSILNLFLVIPEIKDLILPKISPLLSQIGPNYRCINSTFYDKPPDSKWELKFHQDLRINLKDKRDDLGYGAWIKRDGYYQVQPPLEILENIITIRIHLDACSNKNGALKVVPKSHKMGFIDVADHQLNDVKVIEAKEGDLLKMSPLLLHASGYNSTSEKRRVIHLEFSSINLPWYEVYC